MIKDLHPKYIGRFNPGAKISRWNLLFYDEIQVIGLQEHNSQNLEFLVDHGLVKYLNSNEYSELATRFIVDKSNVLDEKLEAGLIEESTFSGIRENWNLAIEAAGNTIIRDSFPYRYIKYKGLYPDVIHESHFWSVNDFVRQKLMLGLWRLDLSLNPLSPFHDLMNDASDELQYLCMSDSNYRNIIKLQLPSIR